MSEQARTVAEQARALHRRLNSEACEWPTTCNSCEIITGAIESALTAYAAEIWEAAAQEAESVKAEQPMWSLAANAIAAALRAHAVSRQEPE